MTEVFFASLAILAIFLNTGTLITGLVKCPPDSNTTTKSFFVPHEDDCQKFYVCHGAPALLSCRANQKFDSITKRCILKDAATCAKTEGTKENKKVTCPDNKNIHIADPNDSTKFYLCSNGVPVQMQCPDELYFNPEVNRCDYQHNVECPADNKPGGSCKAGDLFAHKANCRSFYKCVDGKQVEQQCLGALQYNDQGKYCQWSVSAECHSHKFFFGQVYDCHGLYVVENGVVSKGWCTYENYFDEKLGRCVADTNKQCK